MTRDPRTRAARAGINADPAHKAVVAPIHVSAAFAREEADAPGAFDYARTDHPGRSLLADAVADLDGAAGAVATGSGMAALDLVLELVPPGGRVVCAHDCYGGTRRLMDARAEQGRITLAYVDCTDEAALANALAPGASLLLLETPSNPRLRITDLIAACAAVKAAGGLAVVDNTVLTPALQRPIALGADLAVCSTTKLINGHSDMIGGVVSARNPDCVERLAWWANAKGAGAGAFDAFLALRGLRTLPLRAKAQSETAMALALRLDAHPKVRRVDYPGLERHPGHALAARQQDAFGPLLSIEIDGDVHAARRFAASLALFTLAQSLGAAESLVSIPSLMTHAAISPEARAEAGISDGLVRLSVGLEAAEDLHADLQEALDAI